MGSFCRLLPFAGVVLSDFQDGAVADEVEGGTASGAESVEIETGQAASVLSPVVPACLVAAVPYGADFPGHAAQEEDVSVLDSEAECLGSYNAHVCIIRIVSTEFKAAGAVGAGALAFLSSSP